MKPRVLIVSPQVYPIPHSGAGMRAHFQAVHLSKLWPITLVSNTGVYKVIDGDFEHRVIANNREVPKSRAYVKSLLSSKHYQYERWNCGRWPVPFFDDFTHVIIHFPALLEYIVAKAPSVARVILDTNNNDREYFGTVAEGTSNQLKRNVILRQAQNSEQLVMRSKQAIRATISVSDSDRDWIAPLCANDASHFVVPNNLFTYEPLPWNGRKAILYIGSLDVTMNIQALEWFTTYVWPKLQVTVPNLEFIVAGRNPSAPLVTSLQNKGISVIANAPSTKPLYRDALCAVVPALSGSGSKIKVGEALAHGVPVVSTTHGLIGQPEEIKRCCIVNDDPAEWVNTLSLLASRDERSTPTWNRQVEAALERNSFAFSLSRVARYIEADTESHQQVCGHGER